MVAVKDWEEDLLQVLRKIFEALLIQFGYTSMGDISSSSPNEQRWITAISDGTVRGETLLRGNPPVATKTLVINNRKCQDNDYPNLGRISTKRVYLNPDRKLIELGICTLQNMREFRHRLQKNFLRFAN